MYVVLDASIICTDFRLRGNAFRRLFAEAERRSFAVVVPEICIRESVTQYRREFARHVPRLESGVAGLRRLGLLPLGWTGPNLPQEAEAASAAYEADLRKCLNALECEVLPFPELEHEKLVDRALRRIKPMAGSDRGYRDSLLWANVLDVAARGRSVSFITANLKDFGRTGDEAGLADELTMEVEAAGLSADSISLYRSLDEFTDALASWGQHAMNQVANLTDDPVYSARLWKRLGQMISFGMPVTLGQGDRELLDGSLYAFRTFREVEISDARQGRDGTFLMTFKAYGDGLVEGLVYSEDLPGLLRGESFVLDENWSEHYVSVAIGREIVVTFDACFEAGALHDAELPPQLSIVSMEATGNPLYPVGDPLLGSANFRIPHAPPVVFAGPSRAGARA